MEQTFQRLAREWREETAHLSSMTKMVMHPKYQRIIGTGPAVLPLLFCELQKNPDHRKPHEQQQATPEIHRNGGWPGKKACACCR
jgi:hypothetical protein